MVFAPRSEGGVGHDSDSRCGEAAFLYMPHSAFVIRFESALALRTREKGQDVSDPPQNRGVMRTRIDGIWGMPLSGPMTGRSRPHLSLREGSETAPQERR